MPTAASSTCGSIEADGLATCRVWISGRRSGAGRASEPEGRQSARVLRALVRADWQPLSMVFAHDPPTDLRLFRQTFGPGLRFDQPFTGLVMPAGDLEPADGHRRPGAAVLRPPVAARPAAGHDHRAGPVRWSKSCCPRAGVTGARQPRPLLPAPQPSPQLRRRGSFSAIVQEIRAQSAGPWPPGSLAMGGRGDGRGRPGAGGPVAGRWSPGRSSPGPPNPIRPTARGGPQLRAPAVVRSWPSPRWGAARGQRSAVVRGRIPSWPGWPATVNRSDSRRAPLTLAAGPAAVPGRGDDRLRHAHRPARPCEAAAPLGPLRSPTRWRRWRVGLRRRLRAPGRTGATGAARGRRFLLGRNLPRPCPGRGADARVGPGQCAGPRWRWPTTSSVRRRSTGGRGLADQFGLATALRLVPAASLAAAGVLVLGRRMAPDGDTRTEWTLAPDS